MSFDPHRDGLLLHAGAPLAHAHGLILALHGRGAGADDILALAEHLGRPGLAYLAPEASARTWYPDSFLAPRVLNEPYLTSALNRIAAVIAESGLAPERIVIMGFSQGACLTSEYAATHPARYAALIAFTGGLIGSPGSALNHSGDLAGTPTLLASGDPDPHVPWSRVEETAAILSGMGAQVTTRRYPGRPHTVGAEEITLARDLIAKAFDGAQSPAWGWQRLPRQRTSQTEYQAPDRPKTLGLKDSL